MISTLRLSFIFSLLFREVTFRVSGREKTLYLTFDDGPTPGITPLVLDMLDQYGAKATFFVCGRQAENHPELLQQIRNEGHLIGNHSYSHPNGWKTNTRSYLEDVERAQRVVQSRFFRPPYGKLTPLQYFRLRKHYHIVVWDVMCGDYDSSLSPETCFGNIRQYAVPGSVIVFHDSGQAAPNMLHALAQTLKVYGDEGYVFKSPSF